MEAADFLAAMAGPKPARAAAETADVVAAYQLCRTYALGVDQRDAALVRSVFADDAFAEGLAGKAPIDEYLGKLLPSVERYEATMHNITNQYAVIDGDHGTVWSYCVAVHIEAPGSDRDDLIVGVTYRDQIRRQDGGWIIASRQSVPTFVRGPLNV